MPPCPKIVIAPKWNITKVSSQCRTKSARKNGPSPLWSHLRYHGLLVAAWKSTLRKSISLMLLENILRLALSIVKFIRVLNLKTGQNAVNGSLRSLNALVVLITWYACLAFIRTLHVIIAWIAWYTLIRLKRNVKMGIIRKFGKTTRSTRSLLLETNRFVTERKAVLRSLPGKNA